MAATLTFSEMLVPSVRVRPSQMCPRCAFQRSQRRHFSRSALRHAQAGQVQMPRNIMGSMPVQAQRSRKSMMKEMTSDQLPNDMGLTQGTLIAPSSIEQLALLRGNPKKYFQLQWLRLKKPFISIFSLFQTLKWTTRKDRLTGRPLKRAKMQLRERAAIASQLHHDLGQSISSGNMSWIRENCCQGLVQKLQIRADYRRQARLPIEKWTVEYQGVENWLPGWLTRRIPFPFYNLIPNRSSKPVSDTLTALPYGKDSYMRQVVCQIRSKQTIETGEGQKYDVKQKEMVEYVVIQKMTIEGQDKPWMVWGTVQPSSHAQIDGMIDKGLLGQKGTSGTSFMDQVKNRMMSRGSGSGPTSMFN